jgi:hypothetical protein
MMRSATGQSAEAARNADTSALSPQHHTARAIASSGLLHMIPSGTSESGVPTLLREWMSEVSVLARKAAREAKRVRATPAWRGGPSNRNPSFSEWRFAWPTW